MDEEILAMRAWNAALNRIQQDHECEGLWAPSDAFTEWWEGEMMKSSEDIRSRDR